MKKTWFIYIPTLDINCCDTEPTKCYFYHEPRSVINIVLAILYNNQNPSIGYIKNIVNMFKSTTSRDDKFRTNLYPREIDGYKIGDSISTYTTPNILTASSKPSIEKIYGHICDILEVHKIPERDNVILSFESCRIFSKTKDILKNFR